MRRSILLIVLSLLTACTPPVDRCTADPNLPDCQAARAVAQSTIAAANANTDAVVRQAQMQATRDAVALNAQSTQAAIIISSTAQAVSASATRTMMEMAALRDSLALTATLQAVQGSLAATRTALEGEAKVRAATVEADTAGVRQWIWIVTLVAVVLIVTLSATRTIKRMGEALARKVENSAALMHYGPNNAHAGLIDRGPNGEIIFKPIDQALAALDDWLPRLSVPDQAKLQAIADYGKRSALVEGVGLTCVWPLIEDSEDNASQLTGAPLVQYPYTIATASPTLQPVASWLDEVELKLLPSAAASGG